MTPLPIQAAAIPEALGGNDIWGKAPTGSGKTIAFAVPLVTRAIGSLPGRPRAVVLVPTRELAEQVRAVVASLLPDPRRVATIYGGTGYTTQRRALQRGVDIIVACPGRLEDLVQTRDVSLADAQIVVLDEADRMVDMGFVKPVSRLVDQTSHDRQLLLFSATIGPGVDALSRRFQSRPFRYEVQNDPAECQEVAHLFWRTAREERVGVTARLVERHGQAFVFCRTKRSVDRVTRQLKAAGVEAAPIHGDRSQPQREKALAAFASRRARALVATDVVARGIHVDDIACVVHFDPAVDAETYVHRSGRTGRTGNAGTVVSLVPEDLHRDVQALQAALGLPRHFSLPFEQHQVPREAAPPAIRKAAPPAMINDNGAGPDGSAKLGRANDERASDARASDGRATNGRASDGRATNGRATNGRATNGRATNGRATNGRAINGSAKLGVAKGARANDGPRITGTVKFFDRRRGFGFLEGPAGTEIFVHHSALQAQQAGPRSLVAGQPVTFELVKGRRGEEAGRVMAVGGARS